MKNILLISSIFIFNVYLFSQTTLPNMDFEDWTSYAGGQYEEPSGGVWTTANKVVLLSVIFPVTTEKTTDAYSGTYAAKMTSIMTSISMLVTGSLATGTFNETETPPNNMHLGMPFTGRPEKFTGYYKYINNNGDSCDIYAILSKWDGTTRQEVGRAAMRSTLEVSAYTKFELTFNYTSADVPDSISVVFASSAAGDQMLGTDGSTLYIDSVAFLYPVSINEFANYSVQVNCFPLPADDRVNFEMSRNISNGNIIVFDERGSKIKSLEVTEKAFTFPVNDLLPGKYFYQITEENELVQSGYFVVY
jgi:hypothetical protein